MQSTSEVTSPLSGARCGLHPVLPPRGRPGHEGEGEGAAPLPTCPSPPAGACPSSHLCPVGKPAWSSAARLPAHSTCLMKALRLGLPQAQETWRGARQKGVGCAATPPRWVSAPGSFPGSKPTCSTSLAAQKSAAQPAPPQWRVVAGQPLPP